MGEARLLRPQEARRQAEMRQAPRQHQFQDLVRGLDAADGPVGLETREIQRLVPFGLLPQQRQHRRGEILRDHAGAKHVVEEGRKCPAIRLPHRRGGAAILGVVRGVKILVTRPAQQLGWDAIQPRRDARVDGVAEPLCPAFLRLLELRLLLHAARTRRRPRLANDGVVAGGRGGVPPRPKQRPPHLLPRERPRQRPPRGDGDAGARDVPRPAIPRLRSNRRRGWGRCGEQRPRRRRECVLRTTIFVGWDFERLRGERIRPVPLDALVPQRVRVLVRPLQEARVLQRLTALKTPDSGPRQVPLLLVAEAHRVSRR